MAWLGAVGCGADLPRDHDLSLNEDAAPGRTPVQAVESPLAVSGPIECADPSERDRLGPLYAAPLGAEFAAQVPVGLVHPEPFPAGGVAVVDFTGDGLLDYFLPADTPCMLFVGQPDGKVADESLDRIPLSDTDCYAWGAAAADMDGDGDLDLYLPRERYPDLLWENDGTGHFTDVTARAGIPRMACGSRSASWGDMDGDGDLDLFVARHRVILSGGPETCEAPEAPDSWELESGGQNLLLENNGDGTFTDVSSRLPFRGLHAFSFVGSWIDLDRDRDLDLVVINDFGARATPNTAWMNDGRGNFRELDEDAGLRLSIFGMSVSATDINSDGHPDFAVTDINNLHLLRSIGMLEWIDDAAARDLRPSSSDNQVAAWGAELEDVDNDGLVDFVTVFGPTEDPLAAEAADVLEQPDGLFLQQADGSFVDHGPAWGFDDTGVGRGLVVADLNNDGWLDFVRPDYRRGPTQVHYQRCGSASWLTVELDGPKHGYGARIELEAGGQLQMRWMAPTNESLGSTGPAQVHFGLGNVATVDALRVIWPDGVVGYNRDIDARQHVIVGHPGVSD